MNFKITGPAQGWKAIIAITRTMRDESVFALTQEGILFKTKDASGTAGLYFLWPKDKFKEYSFELDPETTQIEIGYRVEDLEKIVNRFEKDADMQITKSENGKLLITSGKKEYEMSLIHAQDVEVPPKLRVELKANFSMPPRDFKEILEDLKIVSVGIFCDITNGALSFHGHDDNHKGAVLFGTGYPQDAVSQYSIEYLSTTLSSVINFIDTLQVEFDSDMPIVLKMNLPAIGEMTYFLAPMIKN